MEELVVQEGYSVGLFKIGMHKEEVEQCIAYYIDKYEIYGESFFFEYDEEGKVTFIHLIIDELKHLFFCNFKGIDLFNTKADKLTEFFEHISPSIKDDDAALGFCYDYPELGLKFWRGETCTQEDIEADWFKEIEPEIQEDYKRFLYFETVTFYKPIKK